MPKPKNIEDLKSALEEIKGGKIQFGYQCKEISDEILLLTKKSISAQTVRRICGLLPYKGTLRPFTQSALAEYLEIKQWKSKVKKGNLHSNYSRIMIIQLLISMSEQQKYLPESTKRSNHIEILQFLYAHLDLLSPSIMDIMGHDPFMNLWWYHFPPMDMLNSRALRWILPLSHSKVNPSKRIYMESFYHQSQWFSKKKNALTHKQEQSIIGVIQQTSGMIKGKLIALLWWNWEMKNNLTTLENDINFHIKKWKETSKKNCIMEQWQLVENLALLNRFDEAKQLMSFSSQYPFGVDPGIQRILDFWKSIIQIIQGQRGLQHQNLFIEFESHLFFAPKYYELIFVQAILSSKYLRDFHRDKFIQRSDELIQSTGYTYLRDWPVIK
jgi:hypothetical protein